MKKHVVSRIPSPLSKTAPVKLDEVSHGSLSPTSPSPLSPVSPGNLHPLGLQPPYRGYKDLANPNRALSHPKSQIPMPQNSKSKPHRNSIEGLPSSRKAQERELLVGRSMDRGSRSSQERALGRSIDGALGLRVSQDNVRHIDGSMDRASTSSQERALGVGRSMGGAGGLKGSQDNVRHLGRSMDVSIGRDVKKDSAKLREAREHKPNSSKNRRDNWIEATRGVKENDKSSSSILKGIHNTTPRDRRGYVELDVRDPTDNGPHLDHQRWPSGHPENLSKVTLTPDEVTLTSDEECPPDPPSEFRDSPSPAASPPSSPTTLTPATPLSPSPPSPERVCPPTLPIKPPPCLSSHLSHRQENMTCSPHKLPPATLPKPMKAQGSWSLERSSPCLQTGHNSINSIPNNLIVDKPPKDKQASNCEPQVLRWASPMEGKSRSVKELRLNLEKRASFHRPNDDQEVVKSSASDCLKKQGSLESVVHSTGSSHGHSQPLEGLGTPPGGSGPLVGVGDSPSPSSSLSSSDDEGQGALRQATSLTTLMSPRDSSHPIWFVNPDLPGYVGFANLPNQVHRKSVKKGFEFTLMVVGESGLGKSTLINSLFLTDLYPGRKVPTAQEKINKTLSIEASAVEIEERGVKLRLTVVDTPGFGDSINTTDSFKDVIKYIDGQFEKYLNDESGLNRRNITDNRVHCCFYFINPAGHGLKPLDIAFMKSVDHKVNIVPVIAKSDTLTRQEVYRLKRKVMEQIAQFGIQIYTLPDCDDDEDEDYKEQCKQLKAAVPFAVVGSSQVIEVKGRKVRGRMYPWGVVEIENPEHCDFIKLRTMLITHMQDLQEVTQEVHYENFRSEKLAGGGERKKIRDRRGSADIVEKEEKISKKEQELEAKEQELRKMQEMLSKMQAEMSRQKSATLPTNTSTGPTPQQMNNNNMKTLVGGPTANIRMNGAPPPPPSSKPPAMAGDH